MMNMMKQWVMPVPDMRPLAFYGRCVWIVIRLALAFCLANQVSPFFYQRF
jgi:hypothetical protein